ncbi:MAG: aldo/keto reductase [Ignavibacteriaceae bacterium]
MKRREFFKFTALTAGAITVSPYANIFPGKEFFLKGKKYADDIVTLGKTGIKVSRLAVGTGTNGFAHRSNQTEELGISGLADLLIAAYDKGINFWDSADSYGTHPHLKEALKHVKREKVVILTKTHAATADEMKADLDRYLKELGTDYIDILLLHMMRSSEWPGENEGAMEVLEKARKDGVIRAHGVSCHTIEALEAASNSDWVQVDLARINPEGVRMDDNVSVVTKVLKRMHEKGKGIVGMKIFGGGRLTDKPDECLRYVLGLDFVDAFTIGQESKAQMLDLVKRIPDVSI